MSLLLDALKKAAEQKAAKNRQTDADKQASDETSLSESIDAMLASGFEDPTQDIDSDDTEIHSLTLAQARGVHDFTGPDLPITENTGLTAGDFEPRQDKNHAGGKQQSDDETDTQSTESGLIRLDSSEFDETGSEPGQNPQFGSQEQDIKDATGLSVSAVAPEEFEELEFDIESQVAAEDTDLNGGDIPADFDENQAPLLTRDDVGAFLGDDEPDQQQPAASQAEDTGKTTGLLIDDNSVILAESEAGDISIDSGSTGDQLAEDYSVDRPGLEQSNFATAEHTSTGATGEGYSISLFEEDETPFAAQEKEMGLNPDDASVPRSLTIYDISEPALTNPDPGRVEDNDPATVEFDLEPPSKVIAPTETTSTQTHAPDNYDRTLKPVKSREASDNFTGMRSDIGVILTPEYAKNVFRSKISSQRMQNIKIYGGLALVILAVFSGMGVYQLTGDIEKIDTVLRPLKQDPMPGLIRNNTDQEFTDILAAASGSEVDPRVLELVAGAEMGAGIDEVVVEIAAEVDAPTTAADASQIEASEDEPEAVSMDVSEQQPVVESEPVIEASASELINDSSGANTSTTLQISSKTTITKKDQWLREAYAAYQRGDDELAWSKYNQVLEIDPENRNALLARAAINIHNNNITAAIRDYQVLLIANPKDSLAMSSLTAVANFSPQQSESQLKLLIRDEPESPHLNFALGNVYGSLNRWREAQGQYFTALGYKPDDPNYAYNLAVSLEHIDKPKVAISYYQLALDNFNKGLATFNRDVVDQRLEILRQL